MPDSGPLAPLSDPPAVVARPVQALDYGPRTVRPAGPMHLPMLARRVAAIDLALILLVTIVAPFGFQITAWLLTPMELEFDVGPIFVAQKWFDFVLAAGLACYLCIRHGITPAAFGVRWNGLLGVLAQLLWSSVAVAGVYAYLAVSAIVISVLVLLVPELMGDIRERIDVLKSMPVGRTGLTILLLLPVAAHEEIIFRGLLLPYLRRLTGHWWVAVLISSAIFGALHLPQGVLGALQITGIGAVLGLIFVWSRSLLAVTVAHFIFNFVQFQLIRILPDLQELLDRFQPEV